MEFFNELLSFIQTRWLLSFFLSILALAILTLLCPPLRRWFSLKWDDLGVVFPGFGLIAQASYEGLNKETGFSSAEEKLCSIYKKHIPLLDKTAFLERIKYLSLAGDLGRHSTPFLIWLILAVLVVAEALGFSYMLGKWMAMEASENTHLILMFAIVTVICIVMVALTHFAGAQSYRTKMLRAYYRSRIEDSNKDDAQCGEFKPIALSDPQESDAYFTTDNNQRRETKGYQRALNRIARHPKDLGSYAGMGITFIAIAVIAITSTWMRYNALEQELTRETTLQKEHNEATADPFQLALPDEITQTQQQADEKAFTEVQSAMRQEGIAAFIMLAFIFIITQIVGIGAGLHYSLAGCQSKKALEEIKGFESYEAYSHSLVPIRDLANQRLKALQAKLKRESNTQLHLNQTFDDYLNRYKAQMFGSPSPSPALQTAPAASETPQPDFEAICAQMRALNDAQKEKEYFLQLPASLQKDERLLAWLKTRKIEREAQKINVDDYF